MEQKEFLKTIQACRKRLNRAKLLKILVFALCIGASVGILFQIIAFFTPFYYANLYTGMAVLLAVLTALVLAYRKRSTMKQAALVMDSFGFQERIVTAYEHLQEDGKMVRLQRQDAMKQLQAHKGRIQIPLLPEKKRLVGTLGLLCVMVVLMFVPSAMKEQAKELHLIRQEAQEKKEEIEEVLKDMEELVQEELTPEQLAALQEMMESLQSSMTEYEQANSAEMLETANSKLDYKYEDISNQLANMAEVLQNGATTTAQIAQNMQNMAENLQNRNNSQTLASNQGQNGNQSGTGQDGQNGNQSGTGQDGQNGNQSGSGQDGQNGNQSGTDQDGQNGNQSGTGQDGQSGNQSGTGQDGQNGNQSGSGQDGQNGNQSGTGQNGDGQGNGDGSGSGQGSGDGSGSGSGSGRGEGSGSKTHDYVSIPNSIVDTGNLTGNATNHENSEYFRTQNGLSWEGMHVSHEAVIGSYEENAYEGIAAGWYPSGMEDVIKEYFSSFN